MKKFGKVFVLAVASIFALTLSACGAETQDVEFQTTETHLQWRLNEDDEWENLVELDEISGEEGPTGPAGSDGADGVDGAEGPTGPTGPAGSDGAEGPAGADGADGADGAAGADGADGADGVDGDSAYDIYVEKFPGYTADDEQWVRDLANGALPLTIDIQYMDGYTESFDVMMGEAIDMLPTDPTWYTEETLDTEFTAEYAMDDYMLYTADSKYIGLAEERMYDDGTQFNTEGIPNEYLQYAAHVEWYEVGDVEITFEDLDGDVVLYTDTTADAAAGTAWHQVQYASGDPLTALPVETSVRMTAAFTTSEGDTFKYVSEFETTETMNETALELMDINTVLNKDEDAIVATSGVVTSITGADTYTIEDSTGAIFVNNYEGAFINDLQFEVGDSIFVYGERSSSFNGNLTTIDFLNNVATMNSTFVAPDATDLAQIEEDMSPYQAYRLNMDEMVVTHDVDDSGSFSVTLMDPYTGREIDIRYNEFINDQTIVDYLNTLSEGDVVKLNAMPLTGYWTGAQFAITALDQIEDSSLTQTAINTYIGSELELPEETTTDLTLPSTLSLAGTEYTMSWTSSDNVVIDPATGGITRPAAGEADATVTMTATVVDTNAYSETFAVDVIVKAELDLSGTTYTETFTSYPETGSSYSEGTFTGDNGYTWTYTDGRGDQDLGDGHALTFSSNPAVAALEVEIAGGFAAFSVQYTNAFSTPAGLELFINGTSVGTAPEVDGTIGTFEVSGLEIEGTFTFKLVPTNGQTIIDNLNWTDYTAPQTFVETFTNLELTGSSYAAGSYSGDNSITWDYTESRGDYTLDGKAIMLDKDGDNSSLYATIEGGISSFSVDYYDAFSGAAEVELYINDTLIATSPPLDNDGDGSNYGTFEVTGIDVSGQFILKILAADSQTVLDNLTWTQFLG